MEWETTIGLEVHAQLKTQSKIFSGAPILYGATPNTQACAIDLALPGVLPVLNEAVVKMAVKFGLATNAEIAHHSAFDRKNYFYPDLPKGYQISQFYDPIVNHGYVDITLEDNSQKRVNIVRAHLEEDAGKSLHECFDGLTGIDLNRAGTPLLEIVSAPEMHTAKEAVAYLKTLHSLVVYLDICDGNLQEGSFRCDVNVSVRPISQKELGTRTEIKNINSFRFVERAIHYEVERQIDLLESGQKIVQETRLYDADTNTTRSMRSKEEANDYRYFPDPDLLPVKIDEQFITLVKENMPELPQQKQLRFKQEYNLNDYDANILVSNRDMANYFENVAKSADAKLAANWIIGELTATLNREDLEIQDCPIKPTALGALIQRISDQTISNKIAKTVFESLWQQEGSVDEIIDRKGLRQITDFSAIEKLIDEILANNADKVAQYREGKIKLFGYFVGEIMKQSAGKANPQQVNDLLKSKLESH